MYTNTNFPNNKPFLVVENVNSVDFLPKINRIDEKLSKTSVKIRLQQCCR
jgi:hypothetical protein